MKKDGGMTPGMAEKKLGEIRARAIREYGVIEVTIIHRTGVLPIGENILLIAVAAGHRDEAFKAISRLAEMFEAPMPGGPHGTTSA